MTERAPVRLRLLGPTALEDVPDADRLLAGPMRVALLAYLAVARPRGFHRRDALLPLFWPERGQGPARNALSNLLHHVRRAVGDGVVVNRGAEEVGVPPGALGVDVSAFEGALADGDPERALGLYRGDLLEGFHVRGASAAFDHWLDGERRRLRALASDAARSLAEAAGRDGDPGAARSWARRASDLAPFSDDAHVLLVDLLDRAGDRAGALAAHAAFARRLEAELGAAPSPEVEAAVARVRLRPASAAVAGGGPVGPDPRRVAVLPFEVATGGPTAETFATGLHLDVLATLARDPALTVISRGSLVRGDAGALGAGTFVEGVVRAAAGRVRLTVQVVDGRDGRVRWAETLDRDLSAAAAFDLQAELADRITETVHGELAGPAAGPRPAPPAAPDLDAYLLRTRARVHLEQRTERGLRRALALFGEAADRSPEPAAAWAGVAEARALLGYYGYARPGEGPDALGAALRALELDPASAGALVALGVVRAVRQEGPAAARAFARAAEMAPGDPDAHCWLGWTRLVLGEPDAAVAPSERAAELDPLAPAVRVYLAEAYLANGRAGDAVREARRGRELQPDYGLTHFTEGVALHHAGRHGEAAAALTEARVLARVGGGSPARSDVEGALAVVRAATGDFEGARHLLDGLGQAGVPAALAASALGDVGGALDALDDAGAWGPVATVQLRYLFPRALGPVRSHAGFGRVLRRIDEAWGRSS